jgi:hypothetical protein
MNALRAIARLALTAAATLSASAQAAPFDFDCDAPSDRISTVTQIVKGTQPISGTVTPLAHRQGKNPSLAGVQLMAVDGKSGIALQFVIPSPQAPNLDVRVVMLLGGQQTTTPIGTAAVGKPDTHTFSLSLAANGKATAFIDGKAVAINFPYIDQARASVLCGSGQFAFKNTILAP